MMPFHTRVKARSFEEFQDWSRHHGEEFVYVLSGEVELYTEFYEPARLRAGESFYIDSRMGHRVISVSKEDALVLWVSTHTDLGEEGEPSGLFPCFAQQGKMRPPGAFPGIKPIARRQFGRSVTATWSHRARIFPARGREGRVSGRR